MNWGEVTKLPDGDWYSITHSRLVSDGPPERVHGAEVPPDPLLADAIASVRAGRGLWINPSLLAEAREAAAREERDTHERED